MLTDSIKKTLKKKKEIHKNDPFMFLPVSIPSNSQSKRVGSPH